jgi:hypothetical protein
MSDKPYILIETVSYHLCGWFRTKEEAQNAINYWSHANKFCSYKIYHTTEVASGKAVMDWNG